MAPARERAPMPETPAVLPNLPVKVSRKEYERFVANLASQGYAPVAQDGGVYVDHVCVAQEGGDERFVYPAAFARFDPMVPNRHAPPGSRDDADPAALRKRARAGLTQALGRIPGLDHRAVGALIDDLETLAITAGAGARA